MQMYDDDQRSFYIFENCNNNYNVFIDMLYIMFSPIFPNCLLWRYFNRVLIVLLGRTFKQNLIKNLYYLFLENWKLCVFGLMTDTQNIELKQTKIIAGDMTKTYQYT